MFSGQVVGYNLANSACFSNSLMAWVVVLIQIDRSSQKTFDDLIFSLDDSSSMLSMFRRLYLTCVMIWVARPVWADLCDELSESCWWGTSSPQQNEGQTPPAIWQVLALRHSNQCKQLLMPIVLNPSFLSCRSQLSSFLLLLFIFLFYSRFEIHVNDIISILC